MQFWLLFNVQQSISLAQKRLQSPKVDDPFRCPNDTVLITKATLETQRGFHYCIFGELLWLELDECMLSILDEESPAGKRRRASPFFPCMMAIKLTLNCFFFIHHRDSSITKDPFTL